MQREAALKLLRDAPETRSEHSRRRCRAGQLDTAAFLRREAVAALSGLASADKEAAEALTLALQDSQLEVRQEAGEVLTALVSHPSQAVGIMSACLQDTRWFVREAAAEVLGAMAETEDSALLAAAMWFDDPRSWVRRLSVQILGRCAGRGSQLALVAAQGHLADPRSFIRKGAVQVLGSGALLGDSAALAALLACAGDGSFSVKEVVLPWLRRAVRAASAWLASAEEEQRDLGRRMLGAMAVAQDSVEALSWLIGNEQLLSWIKVAAFCLTRTDPAVSFLVVDSASYVRATAVELLKDRAAAGDSSSIEALCLALEDNLEVRQAAIETLGGVLARGFGVGAVCRQLGHREAEVRQAAVEVLCRADPVKVMMMLPGPRHPNAPSRSAVVQVVGAMASKGHAEAFSRLQDALHDENAAVRQEALKAWCWIDPYNRANTSARPFTQSLD
ncbi:unnamed protein product [Effrenium voratum]|nr:unnamed protein product [Effrenium voratum]